MLFAVVCPFFNERYNDKSSKFYNPHLRDKDGNVGGIDGDKVNQVAEQKLMFYNVEHYLHIPRDVVLKMTRDQYLVACREAHLIRQDRIKTNELSVHNAVVSVVNEMFSSKGSRNTGRR